MLLLFASFHTCNILKTTIFLLSLNVSVAGPINTKLLLDKKSNAKLLGSLPLIYPDDME